MVCKSNLEKKLEDQKTKNSMLEKQLLKLQQCYETRMKQQMLVFDQMVASHQRMVVECEAYTKQLRLNSDENFRFRLVEQWLTTKARELTGDRSVPVIDDGDQIDRYSNVAENLEDSCHVLMNELRKSLRRNEEMSKELAEIEDRLAKSKETQKSLKECADILTESDDADRNWRERSTAHLRAMTERWSAELDLVKLDAANEQLNIEQRGAIMSEITAGVEVYRSDADEFVNGLRDDKVRLTDELEKCSDTVHGLRAKVAVLKDLSQHKKWDSHLDTGNRSSKSNESYQNEFDNLYSAESSLHFRCGDDDDDHLLWSTDGPLPCLVDGSVQYLATSMENIDDNDNVSTEPSLIGPFFSTSFDHLMRKCNSPEVYI